MQRVRAHENGPQSKSIFDSFGNLIPVNDIIIVLSLSIYYLFFFFCSSTIANQVINYCIFIETKFLYCHYRPSALE